MKRIATVVLALVLAPVVVFGQTPGAAKSVESVSAAGVTGLGGGQPSRSMPGTPFRIAPEQLTGIRLSQAAPKPAQPARNRGVGRIPMLVGALVGGATGMAFGAASYNPDGAAYSRGQLAAIGGGTLAAAGAFMGWLVNQ